MLDKHTGVKLMFEIMPEVPLFFKALILLGFIVLMVGIAGLVLLVGRNKQAKESDTYDIVKKRTKTPKAKTTKKVKENTTKVQKDEWDEEPSIAFGKTAVPAAKQATMPVTPAAQPAQAPKLAPAAKQATMPVTPAVQQTFTPVETPVQPETLQTFNPSPVEPQPKTGGPFGQPRVDTDESEW